MRIFWDEAQLGHAPGFFLQRGRVRANFETPERARSLLQGIRALGLTVETPPLVEMAALETVHRADYLAFLRDSWSEWTAQEDCGPEVVANVHPSPEMLAQGGTAGSGLVGRTGWFTADAACPIGEGTWPAALSAASCALAAAEAVAGGGNAYALVRPPGHHAYAARAGGHCYLNNAALAAELLRRSGAVKVAVLDIDSHHGNGTQGIFWDRLDVLFVSVHGDPAGYYPWYVGHAGERGVGAGDGYNLNLPLPRNSGDAEWLDAIETGLAAVRRFGPDALVVSLGFDASEHEPLNYLAVTAAGFARAGGMIGALGLPTAIVQEGGYDTERLGSLLALFLGAFSG